MNTVLNIQIKIAAEQAQAALKQLNAGITGLGSSGASSGALAKGLTVGLSAAEKQIAGINARIKEMQASLGGFSVGGTSTVKGGAAAAAREEQAAVAAAKKAETAASLAASREQAAAAKQAAAEEAAVQKQQSVILASAWKQQVVEAKTAKAEQAAAAKEEARQEIASAKEITAAKKEALAAEVSAQREANAKLLAASRELAAKQKELARSQANPETQLTGAGKLSMAVNGTIDTTNGGLIQMGKNLQWVGRQLNFNFTLPIALATKAVMGWALSNEAAMTRLQRVYSGPVEDIALLQKAFEMMSSHYGVAQSEVDALGASWAAAGVKGADLGKVVKTSLDLSILGNYSNLDSVFTDLVTVMGAFNLTADQLSGTIAILNRVDNESATTLQDLVTGMARAGGAATVAKVGVRELAAMIATLTPTAGSAASAGISLNRVFSKLSVDTPKMAKALKEVGVATDSMAYKTANGTEKLQMIADVFGKATDSQKALIASTVGGLFQVNRMDVLLGQMADSTSAYHKVLDSLNPSQENTTHNMDLMTKQVQTLLKSDPSQLKQLTESMKNLLADAIVPLIPAFIMLVSYVKAVVDWFVHLSPTTLKIIVGIVALVAAIGILAQVIGSVELLFGTFGKALVFVMGLFLPMETETATYIATVQAQTLAVQEATAVQIEANTAAAAAKTASDAEMVASAEASGLAIATSAELTAGAVDTASVSMAASEGLAFGWIALIVVAIVAAIAVAVVLIIKYHTQIGNFFKSVGSVMAQAFRDFIGVVEKIASTIANVVAAIGNGMWGLATTVGNALMAVLRVVASIVTAIVDWLSYLNPFQHHSPSLVENVTAGISVIIAQYGRLRDVGSELQGMARDIKNFNDATKGITDAARNSDRDKARKDVGPAATPKLNTLYADQDQLQGTIDQITTAIAAQERVVAPLKVAYDDASQAVNAFQAGMKPLSDLVNSQKTALDAAKAKITEYANTSITGQKAAAQATFENTMAQKALELQIMDLTSSGKGLTDIATQISLINGEMQTVQGKLTTLRNAGAGSDVTGVYQTQLDSLKASKAGLEGTAATGTELTKQLAVLQAQAARMNLVDALKFDPLTNQIKNLADTTKELSFDQIVKGITDQQQVVGDLTTAYDTNKAALDAQQLTLDGLINKRDTLQASYDLENTTLTNLQTNMQAYKDELKAIDTAIQDVISAQTKLNAGSKAGGGGKKGKGGGGPGTNFDPTAGIDALKNTPGSIGDLITQMEKEFGKIGNPFKKFGQWVKDVKQWYKDAVAIFKQLWHDITPILDHIGHDVSNWAKDVYRYVLRLGQDITNWTNDIKAIWNRIYGDVKGFILHVGHDIAQWAKDVYSDFLQFGQDISNWTNDIKAIWDRVIGDISQWATDFANIIKQGWRDVSQWASDIKAIWDRVIGDLTQWSTDFQTTISNGINAVIGFFQALPGNILNAVATAGQWLRATGTAIISGLWSAITEKAKEVWAFFGSIQSTVSGFFSNAIGWLSSAGGDIIRGIKNGFDVAWNDVTSFLGSIPSTISGYFGDAIHWLWQAGHDIIRGIKNGFDIAWQDVTNFLGGIVGGVINSIPNPLDILHNIGVKILQGFLDGLQSMLKSVLDFFSTLTNLIPFKKGPPSRDATLLVNNGKLIMQGLHTGLKHGWNDVETWLSTLDPSSAMNIGGFNSAISKAVSANVSISQKQPMIKSITMTGDLSFPNITSPDDAEKFLTNLETLAGAHK